MSIKLRLGSDIPRYIIHDIFESVFRKQYPNGYHINDYVTLLYIPQTVYIKRVCWKVISCV